MAITKLTNTITDTNTRYSVQHTGLADGATQLTDSIWANLSALKYATATVTLAAAPTANFCIGETVTTNDSTPIYVRVTDYTAGAATFKCYKVTSATDITPLAWTAETATDIGTGKTLTGSVSGLSSATTHGSTRLSIATPTINLRKLWWNIASGFDHVRVYFDVSEQEAANRIFDDKNALRDRYNSVEEVKEANRIRKANEITRYEGYYGIDVYHLDNFDVVVDTTDLTLDEVYAEAVQKITSHLANRLSIEP